MLVLVAELKSVPLTVTRVLLSSPPVVESVLAAAHALAGHEAAALTQADGRGRHHALLQGVAAVADQHVGIGAFAASGPRPSPAG